MSASTPEGKVKDKIKELFKKYGVWYCMPMGQLYGKRGVPDFVACINGRFLAVEAKAAKGKPSPAQLLESRRIRDAGGMTLFCYPDTLPLLEEVLEKWKRLDE